MSPASVVIVARPDHARSLRKRVGSETVAAVFLDSESLQAADIIVSHPPRIVALDPTFVTTARGAALVARIKSESALAHVDVRILAYDADDLPLILEHKVTTWDAVMHKMSLPLDRCGTREGNRFAVNGNVTATINGEKCQLIDLSVSGAQALLRTRLRPDQSLRINLTDPTGRVTCKAVVAWAIAEPKGSAVQYRVGMRFLEADVKGLEALCARAGAPSQRKRKAS